MGAQAGHAGSARRDRSRPRDGARNGPIEGSLVLFEIDEAANENRPLVLDVPGPDGVGEIVLDL